LEEGVSLEDRAIRLLQRLLQSHVFHAVMAVTAASTTFLSGLADTPLFRFGVPPATLALLARCAAGPAVTVRLVCALFVLVPLVDCIMSATTRTADELTEMLASGREHGLGVVATAMTAGTWLGAQHEDHLSREQKIRWAAIFAGLCLCDSGAAFARSGDVGCFTIFLLYHHLPFFVCLIVVMGVGRVATRFEKVSSWLSMEEGEQTNLVQQAAQQTAHAQPQDQQMALEVGSGLRRRGAAVAQPVAQPVCIFRCACCQEVLQVPPTVTFAEITERGVQCGVCSSQVMTIMPIKHFAQPTADQ